MKGRVVTLGEIKGRKCAALMVDGRLDDFLIDAEDSAPPTPGTIFRGICDRPLKGQGGMMLRLPTGNGYLRQGKGLKPGQPLLVQVTGYADDGKAVPLTEKLVLKGRNIIVTPTAAGINVSRSVKDEEERVRLRGAVDTEKAVASGFGVIVRTQATETDADTLSIETDELIDLTSDLLADQSGAEPEFLLDGPDAHMLAWREWGAPDLLDDGPDAFENHGVLDALAGVLATRVPLSGAGAIFIEPTRALVAVDVNTGGDTSPAAGLKANLATARDLARQLRCRGLGGQITVDFAPMLKRDRRELEQLLRSAFRADTIDTVLAGWTPLGHFELQRKRERLPIPAGLVE